jgi:hypothetical protein
MEFKHWLSVGFPLDLGTVICKTMGRGCSASLYSWQLRKLPTIRIQALDEMQEVVSFLLGERQIDGLGFGEFPDNGEKYKRRYWWRGKLRSAWGAVLKGKPSEQRPNPRELITLLRDALDNLKRRGQVVTQQLEAIPSAWRYFYDARRQAELSLAAANAWLESNP